MPSSCILYRNKINAAASFMRHLIRLEPGNFEEIRAASSKARLDLHNPLGPRSTLCRLLSIPSQHVQGPMGSESTEWHLCTEPTVLPIAAGYFTGRSSSSWCPAGLKQDDSEAGLAVATPRFYALRHISRNSDCVSKQ